MFIFNRLYKAKYWQMTVLIAIFLTLIANVAFFKHVIEVYSFSSNTFLFILSLGIVLSAVTLIVLNLLSWGKGTKPLLVTILMVSSFVAYFMDSYDVVIDTHMIDNILQTNVSESSDLFSIQLILYVLFIGLIPSWIVIRLQTEPLSFKAQLIEKGKILGIALGIIMVVLALFNKNYTSFFREHKPLRYYANPGYYIYSIVHYVQKSFAHSYTGLKVIGKDATIPKSDVDRELVILVVGEAARWDHFSLNGYTRETNPMLKKEDIINFAQFSSCGTETAVSVPCMFSSYTREEYEKEKALHTENLLDVLTHAGVNVLWRDNNSDSKGVAIRTEYQDYKDPKLNSVCEAGECRDEGMLIGLDEYIKAHPKGDIVIILHQMGNHGPAYYKRYPQSFEKFTPVCKSNQLEQCSEQEITNAYDNAILYTDAFLSKTINFLKRYDDRFETAMFYVSDHGESLGEKGLYLHGFPYSIAPEAQKHVPAIMWFGKRFAVNKQGLQARKSQLFSHDHYFHTVLNLFEINTSVHQNDLDILHGLH